MWEALTWLSGALCLLGCAASPTPSSGPSNPVASAQLVEVPLAPPPRENDGQELANEGDVDELPKRKVAGMLGLYLERGRSPQQGVRIVRVMTGFPAHGAGLRVGQRLLTIDGRPVNTYKQVIQTLNRYQAGDVVTLGVLDTAGDGFAVEVTLDPPPESVELPTPRP